MSQLDRLERDLAAWFAESAQPGAPASVDQVLSATRSMRQRPWWSFAGHWLPRRLSRPVGQLQAWVPWRAIGLIALASLLLAVALAIVVGSQRRMLPAPFGLARNGLVAFGDAGDIVIVDPSTNEPRSIVTGPADDHDPRFSLDGTRLAFLREVAGGQRLVVTDVDGHNPVVSGGEPLVEADSDTISWSPSGRAVAITASGPNGLSLVVIDTTDGSLTAIDSGYYGHEAHWRPPDGRELMVVGGPSSNPHLVLYSLDHGSEPQEFQVVDGDPDSIRPIGWMSNGRTFAYQLYHLNWEANATHVLDLDTLVEVTLRIGMGRISNRGDRIVGFDGRGDDYQLCVVNLPVGPCNVITGPTAGPDPFNRAGLQWSPDDRYIIVRKPDGEVRAYDPDGRAIDQPPWLRYGGESVQRLAP